MGPSLECISSNDVIPNISPVHLEEKEVESGSQKPQDSSQKKSNYESGDKRSLLLVVSETIVKSVECACGFWGLQVARRPLLAGIVSLLVVAFLGSGLIRLNLVFRPYDLWVPQGSEFSEVTAWKMKNFPPLYREQVAIWEANNVLTADVVREMWKFREEVKKIETPLGNTSVGWEDVCIKIPTKASGNNEKDSMYCFESSLLELWDPEDSAGFENLTDVDVLETLASSNVSRVDGSPTDFSVYLGAIRRDKQGRIVGAGSAMHTWLTIIDKDAISQGAFEVDVATGEKVDIKGMAWEKALVRMADGWLKRGKVPPGLSLNLRAGHTLGYVLHGSLTGDAVWIGVGWGVLLIYVLLTMGRPLDVEQRIFPACVGLLAIGMAVLSSYGACSLMGVPYGTLNNVLPVLLVALGVDDMYVIVTAWDACGLSRGSVEMRAERAMRRAGMAITVTSVTDVLAFLVGTTTALPGLRWFCIYAAVGITMVFFLQGTLFVAAMVVNESWDRGKSQPITEEKRTLRSSNFPGGKCFDKLDVRQGMTNWGRCLLRPVSKGIVCSLTLIIFAFALFNTTLLGREFDTMWLIPEGSSLQNWFRTVEQQFPQVHERGVVLFRGARFPDDLSELRRLSEALRSLPEIRDVDAWFEGLDLEGIFERHGWLRRMTPRRQCQLLLKNIGIAKRRHFRVDFDLEVEVGRDSKADSEGADSLHPCSTFQIEFQYLPPPTFELKQASMRRIRQLVHNSNVSGYRGAWAHVHAQWETDRVILGDLLRSLCVVLVAVGVISLILLASVRAAIFVLLCVIGTLVSVASMARLWGLSVNTVTGIAFVIAVGICVDYAAHIAHDFLFTYGTKTERVLAALHRMGAAVFHGGASTFITFLLLAPSDNYISASYFKILTSVSFFGLFHALVFLPVLLSLFGPEPHPINAPNLPQALKENLEAAGPPPGGLSVYAIDLPPPFRPPPYLLTHPRCPPLYRKSSSLPSLAVFLSDGDSTSRETRSTSNASSASSSEGSFRHSTYFTKL